MTESRRTPLVLTAALAAATATVLLLALLSGPARAVRADPGTLYVAPPPAGNDSMPCSSIQPCATVQRAVDVAIPGGEILVATGHYTGVHARGAVTQVVYISKTVTIQGGYSADFLVWDPQAHPTTLDAEGEGRVVLVTGSGITATLEALRITGGDASGAGGASPGLVDHGGGIQVFQSVLVLMDSEVYSNTSPEHGGGIYLASSSYAALTGNRVFSNTAGLTSGGINMSAVDGAMLADNVIYGNTASGSYGGGMLVSNSSAVALMDNTVFSNSVAEAGGYGGGIAVRRCDGVTLTGNVIYSNTAGFRGGGIHLENTTDATVARNAVHRNTAPCAVAVLSGQGVALVNNVIVENYGCGVRVQGSDARMLHTTLARNKGARALLSEGGATLWMTNTIVVSHTGGLEAGGAGTVITAVATLWGEGDWANENYDVSAFSGGTVITVTDIWGDPDFVEPAVSNYHIGPGSAAIGKGANTDVSTDIDGQTRLGAPDLGADEFIANVYLPLVLRNH
jgi:parallel beta-helix repeat protein